MTLKNSFIGFFKSNKQHPYRLFNALLTVAAFILTVIIAANGSFMQKNYNIEVSKVSDRDFFAPKDIIDERATQDLIAKEISEVADIYNHDSTVDSKVIAEIDSFFDTYADVSNQFKGETLSVGVTENIYITQPQYKYLAAMSSTELASFHSQLTDIAQNVLNQGIREDNTDTTLASVNYSIKALGYDAKKTEIAFNIISSSLSPNMLIDQEATQQARDRRAAEVEPVIVLANQKIVGEGEVITDEIYDLLVEAGYLKSNDTWGKIIKVVSLVILLVAVFAVTTGYIYLFHKDFYVKRNLVLLVFTLYMLVVITSYFMTVLPYMLVPVLAVTMIVALLFNTSLAFISNILMSIVSMLVYNGDIQYLTYFALCGSMICIIMRLANERNKILLCGVISALVDVAVMLGILLFFDIYWKNHILMYSFYSFASGIISIIICMGSIPLLESAFGVVTDFKLKDLANSNQKLLRRLMLEAPGTYHHSLIVGNLSEAAAFSIGANPSLARTGAYYHDIGKLAAPLYFAENMHGSNIHDKLSPYDSAEIIIRHPDDGVALAQKNHLPPVIIDIIKEHHGTSLVKFFYYKACKEAEANEQNKPDEINFRYPGKLPSCKESAIVMLADTVEAAVRSSISKGMTAAEVKDFIDTLINDKLNDNQLSESDLSINDLHKIEDAFWDVFKGMYHERVAYPNQKNKE